MQLKVSQLIWPLLAHIRSEGLLMNFADCFSVIISVWERLLLTEVEHQLQLHMAQH